MYDISCIYILQISKRHLNESSLLCSTASKKYTKNNIKKEKEGWRANHKLMDVFISEEYVKKREEMKRKRIQRERQEEQLLIQLGMASDEISLLLSNANNSSSSPLIPKTPTVSRRRPTQFYLPPSKSTDDDAITHLFECFKPY